MSRRRETESVEKILSLQLRRQKTIVYQSFVCAQQKSGSGKRPWGPPQTAMGRRFPSTTDTEYAHILPTT
ncbi:hypothetical protein ANCDUO_09080 [Ancylostoma duodenale]|uniref:Uncharacterized protein n=1 Tax=Ancylostoma duodenale TaxID=51022 RepID=A0A0C2GHJ6_9BILA|nr:hypothetical protein ANCDUO_09080 [Ancylostoma duodenale]